MKIIYLNNGKECFVSDEDFDMLSRWSWTENTSGYATCWDTSINKNVRMHRMLLNPGAGLDVDHIDNNRLNNQRSNLRAATRAMNNGNRVVRKDSGSGVKGVRFNRNAWCARIVMNYKEVHLGRFKTIGEATEAYNRAAKEYFGEFARLNEV